MEQAGGRFRGKSAFAVTLMGSTCALVTVSFVVLAGLNIVNVPLCLLTLLGTTLALSFLMTLISALISKGNNRNTLAGAVAVPLLVPLVALGASALRCSLDGAGLQTGWSSCFAVWLYTGAVVVTAPHQFSALWSGK